MTSTLGSANALDTVAKLESEVRSYCRLWPAVFDRGEGSKLIDTSGREYLDFFAGAGALNYGHNHPVLVERLVDYVRRGGIIHSLDTVTSAKAGFLETFGSHILGPRGFDYRLQFTGPTGTNAVESALKLARKVTGRSTVVTFTNAFHGMTLGSLAATGAGSKRSGAGLPLIGTARLPYDGYLGADIDTLDLLAAMLDDPSSGLDHPAAVLVETVQGEGGVNAASVPWLRRLEDICRRNDMLLIVDDIQAGCGRTGTFFSFEEAGLRPDLVCLSKSISGIGLPMALLLIRPDLDRWEPGEHNGTFRGNNAAFVTATASLEHFWTDGSLTREVQRRGEVIEERLTDLQERFSPRLDSVRGRGMLRGIRCQNPEDSAAILDACFRRGLVIEASGGRDEVVKLLPPLTTPDEELARGLEILTEAMASVLGG